MIGLGNVIRLNAAKRETNVENEWGDTHWSAVRPVQKRNPENARGSFKIRAD
jgi:hypothetical protein